MTNAVLIAKLESAKEGSRALSDEVLTALGWRTTSREAFNLWYRPDATDEEIGQVHTSVHRVPDPTRNLQCTIDLVPEGWIVADLRQRINPPVWHWYCALSYLTAKFESFDIRPDTEAATPALALSICILKALEAGDG